MGRALCIATGMILAYYFLQPEPKTIIDILTVLWVLYAGFYAFMWLCGKFIMSAVRRGIRDGTLKFTVKTTEEKDEGSD